MLHAGAGAFRTPTHKAGLPGIYVGWRTESPVRACHGEGNGIWLASDWRLQMNDEIEHPTGMLYRAIAPACPRWRKLGPAPVDAPKAVPDEASAPESTAGSPLAAKKKPA